MKTNTRYYYRRLNLLQRSISFVQGDIKRLDRFESILTPEEEFTLSGSRSVFAIDGFSRRLALASLSPAQLRRIFRRVLVQQISYTRGLKTNAKQLKVLYEQLSSSEMELIFADNEFAEQSNLLDLDLARIDDNLVHLQWAYFKDIEPGYLELVSLRFKPQASDAKILAELSLLNLELLVEQATYEVLPGVNRVINEYILSKAI